MLVGHSWRDAATNNLILGVASGFVAAELMANPIGAPVFIAGVVAGAAVGVTNGWLSSTTGKRYSDGIYGLLD